MVGSSSANKKERKAQQNKKYKENLKNSPQYGDYKKKQAALMKKYREKKRADVKKLPLKAMNEIQKANREAVRERVRKCRARMRLAKVNHENVAVSDDDKSERHTAYKSVQSLGKAVSKAVQALPRSPTKKTEVLSRIILSLENWEKNKLSGELIPPKKTYSPNVEINSDIIKFYERDDISRTSPKIRDVKKYQCANTGDKVLLPTRHMLLSSREAFALFDEDQISKGRDTCSLSHFTRTRPQYVKLTNNMPHNMCLCTYHSNFIEAVTTLCKKVQNIPNYDNGFVNHFLCKESSIACWYGNCEKCSGKFVSKMEEFVLNTPSTSTLKWSAWEKDVSTKRVEKKEKTGTMDELINYVNKLWPQFLKHSFNKREQALTFNEFDRPRALSTALVGEGLLQIDFAENYVCEAQDEVQNAHWNQRQLTLFTSGFYYNNVFQAKVYVSDNLSHTKDSIVTYLWKLLSSLPSSLKILKIWSDGPSSQFKNKFIAALIPYLEIKFGIKIFWNYFATSHGKGCVDGIGATVKTVVRKHVIARNIIVNCAVDFKNAFYLTASKIVVEAVKNDEFVNINNDIEEAQLFSKAKNVQNISNAHQIQAINGKVSTFPTSKQGYI